MSKLIIHNSTDLDDAEALEFIQEVVKEGKVSETFRGKQYCFATRLYRIGMKKSVMVISNKIKDKDTYTFYINYESEDK